MDDNVRIDLFLPVLRKFSSAKHRGSVSQHNATARFLLERGLLVVTDRGEVVTTNYGEKHLNGVLIYR